MIHNFGVGWWDPSIKHFKTQVQTVFDGVVDLVADPFLTTHDRYQYVDFIYLNYVSETKIISRTSHHPTGKFMTDVFTDVTYIWFAVAMVFLCAFIHTWIFYFEEHKLKKLDFIYFVGNLVNQPFPESIKVGKFLDKEMSF